MPFWDNLVRGQQVRLEALKVPTMFVTNDPSDVEVCTSNLHVKWNPGDVRPHTLTASSAQKQRRVMNVLELVLPVNGTA